MQRKTQDAYEELLRTVMQGCSRIHQLDPDPHTVVTDFELSAMFAVRNVLGEAVTTHGCFYHLTQSTWRKIQDLGLQSAYRSDDDIRLFVGMLDGLAYLPVNDVTEGYRFLKTTAPSGLVPLVEYFGETYVTGTTKTTQTGRTRTIPPRFPPTTWNVHETTFSDEKSYRTNNNADGWNNHFYSLVGMKHPVIWRCIEALQADAAQVSAVVMRRTIGNLSPRKISATTKSKNRRLRNLCAEYRSKQRSLENFLRAIGEGIRLVCD
jgi:hypothetical protein